MVLYPPLEICKFLPFPCTEQWHKPNFRWRGTTKNKFCTCLLLSHLHNICTPITCCDWSPYVKWQPMLATKPNSAVLIWYQNIWRFNHCCIVVDVMIQWTVNMLCSTINPTNRTANKNQAWLSQMQPANQQQSTVRKEDAHCRITKFLPSNSLFLSLATMIFLWDFATKHMFTSFSKVSSDIILEICIIKGKKKVNF